VGQEVPGGELHRFGGLGGALLVAENDRGARLGGYYREVGILEHGYVVGEAHRQGATGSPLPDDHGHNRHRSARERHEVGGDSPRLAPLLGVAGGGGARRVDERHDGQLQSLGQPIEPAGLAVALRVGHAEVALHPAVDLITFVVAQEDDRVRPYLRESPAHRRIVRAQPVAREPVEAVR
jgi:hypothetical protein